MAQDPPGYYYYKPDINYGSELNFNPYTVFINGAFDILRNGGHSKNIFDQEYAIGFKNVWKNITHPIKNIEQIGWKEFIGKEVFPLSLKAKDARYLPNYMHHVLGSGMIYKKLAEWYDYHGVPYPHITSMATSMFYHYINEVLENENYKGSNTDPIADLLIFNPIGIALFSTRFVNRFFSETLTFHDWSLQPVLNPWNYRLENAGQQFILKYQLPFAKNYSVFTYWGIDGISGISYTNDNVNHFSFGIGQVVNKLNENLLRDSRFMTPKTDGAIGFFYDKNHSLLLSAVITGPRLYNLRINILPGLIALSRIKPGFYLGAGEWDYFIFGITFAPIPIGLCAGSGH